MTPTPTSMIAICRYPGDLPSRPRHMARKALLAYLLLLNSIFITTAAYAQNQNPTPKALQQQLTQLETQLATEKQQLTNLLTAGQAALGTEKEKRRTLAEQVLDLEQRKQQITTQNRQLRTDLEQTIQTHQELLTRTNLLAEQAATTAEQLAIYLAEIPAHQDCRRRLQRPHEPDAEPDHSIDTTALVEIIDELHQQATAVSVRQTTLHTADGQLEPTSLLCLGHVAFAYQTTEGSRTGLALNSPTDATGYRWTEKLGSKLQADIAGAIQRIRAGAGGIIAIPIDISKQLRAQSFPSSATFIARLRSGGPVMIPLLAIALIAFILILQRALILQRHKDPSDKLLTKVLQAVGRHDYDQAHNLCRKSGGAVARTLLACLNHRDKGQSAMEDSIQEQLLHDAPQLQRFLGGIMALGAVAPLLGLLGTVTGIIQTFAVIKAHGNSNPDLMAGGISEALVTTATGLTIAIPILLIHRLLHARAERIISDAEKSAATLLNTLMEVH